jgi:dienelactone hydrolase
VTDTRCDYTYPSANRRDCHIDLRGWLYYEQGKKIMDAPLIVYNHGHNQERSQPCAIVRFFVKQGYVVFAPLRRGHTSSTASSTGTYLDDYVDQCKNCNQTERNKREVDYTKIQRQDVESAINYMKKYPYVPAPDAEVSPLAAKLIDPDRIAIMGHSFGGSLVLFANALPLGHTATIDISGAALSWPTDDAPGNPEWKPKLKKAVEDAETPIFFLQPKNEVPPGSSTEPTQYLSGIAMKRLERTQAALFPKTCIEPGLIDDETGDPMPEGLQAHSNFITLDKMVANWGPAVDAFLKLYWPD